MPQKSAFICHASSDHGFAQRLCDLLESRGIGCWIAPRDIQPGEIYGEAIIDALESCFAIIVLISEGGNASRFVMNELERAVSKGKTVFPIRVREVRPSKSIELYVGASQWIDAFKPPLESSVDLLAKAILSLRPDRPAAAPESPAAIPDGKRPGDDPVRPPNSLPKPPGRAAAGPALTLDVPPPPESLVFLPEPEIRTGTSILRAVQDKSSGTPFLLKTIPRQNISFPILPFSGILLDDGAVAAPLSQWADEDSYYELLPRIDGWTLADIILINKEVVGDLLSAFSRSLLRLLLVLQENAPPLIHRDINPANIMVRRDDLSSLVLVDCMTMIPSDAAGEIAPIGTPGYMPPEARQGRPGLAYDLYSVGCTIYALNHCSVPPNTTERRHFNRAMTLRGANDELDHIFPGLIALDPAQRYPNARSAWQACLEYRAGTRWVAPSPHPFVLPDGRRIEQICYR